MLLVMMKTTLSESLRYQGAWGGVRTYLLGGAMVISRTLVVMARAHGGFSRGGKRNVKAPTRE